MSNQPTRHEDLMQERAELRRRLAELEAKLEPAPSDFDARAAEQAPPHRKIDKNTDQGTLSDEALENERVKFQTVAENAPCGLLMMDPDGTFTYANPKFTELFGYDLSETSNGREWFRKAYPDRKLRREVISAWITDLENAQPGEQRPRIFPVRLKNGAERMVRFTAAQLPTGEHLMTCEDVTDRIHAEERLKSSEEKFRALSDASFEAVFLSDKGICVEQNLAAEKMFGYSSEEARGQKGTDGIHPDYRELVMKNMLSGYEEPYEAKALRKDGSSFPCEIQGRMIDYEGRRIRVTALRDISDRNRAQEALRSSEQRLKTLIETMNEAFGMQDENGVITYVNEKQCRMLGYSREEMVGRRFPDLFDEASKQALLKQFERRKRGEGGSYEVTFVRKDGGLVDAIISGTPIFGPDDAIEGSFGVATDITARKRMEEALKKSEANYRTIFNSVNDLIFAHDAQTGGIIDVNEKTCEVLGYTVDEFRQLRVEDWSSGEPPYTQATALNVIRKALDGNPQLFEWHCKSRSGRLFWAEVNLQRAVIGDRRCVLAVVRDISERKGAEKALQQSEERFKTIYEDAPVMMQSVDKQGNIRNVNRKWLSELGYERDQVVGRSAGDLLTPGPTEARGDVAPELWPSRGVSGLACLCTKRDGTVIDVLLDSVVLTDSQWGELNLSVLHDVTERNKAEAERAKYLRFLESLDRIERTMAEAADLEDMMRAVLEAALSIFQCDRAWVMHPCDPEAEVTTVAIEVTRPEYASALPAGQELRVTPDLADAFRASLNSRGPVVFHPEVGLPLPQRATAASIQSSMNTLLAPSVGSPWLMGISQCTHPRVWSEEDKRLFHEIGNRLADSLNILILLQDLRESEERFRTAFRTSPDSAIITSLADGRYVYVNDSFSDMTGFAREEVIGKTAVEMDIWKDRKDRERLMAALREHGEVSNLEAPFRLNDGRIRTGLVSARIMTMDGALHVLSMTRDIEDWRRAEEDRTRLAAAIEQAAESVEITDTDGVILYVNPAYEEITGYTREEAIGKNPSIVKSGRQDRAFYKELWETIIGGRVWKGRLVNKKKDGSRFEVEAGITPIKDDSGHIAAYVAVKRDVTNEVILQEQLLEAQKMEAVGTLAGGIAHDFNNLLHVIQGFADLALFRVGEGKPGHQEFRQIKAAAKSAAELTRGLLTFSRRVESNLGPVNLNHELRLVTRMLKRTIPKMIEIELKSDDRVHTINADSTQLQQLVMNLAVNARDAMPNGGKFILETKNVHLDAEYCRTHLGTRPGPHVLLSASDTGIGMDKETVDHIFDPFYTTKEVGKGTGLGLSIVFGVVQNHGGAIHCHSEPGRGSVFKIYLPADTPDPGRDDMDEGEPSLGGSETILLVDDEEGVRTLGVRGLSRFGYRILTANNGREALDLFKKDRDLISLVILDLVMPVMGGRECMRELLKEDPSVKIIIASGYAADGQLQSTVKEGAKTCVQKPYTSRDLLEVVRRVLDKA